MEALFLLVGLLREQELSINVFKKHAGYKNIIANQNYIKKNIVCANEITCRYCSCGLHVVYTDLKRNLSNDDGSGNENGT